MDSQVKHVHDSCLQPNDTIIAIGNLVIVPCARCGKDIDKGHSAQIKATNDPPKPRVPLSPRLTDGIRFK